MTMPPPPPPMKNGEIDVTPTALYMLSGYVAHLQDGLNKGANHLLDELGRYPDCGGYGTAAWEFAAAYKKVGNRFFDVWAKSVASVGGAAVGFTTTANNYAAADAATDPSGAPAQTRQPPAVIDTPPNYRSVTDLKWADIDQSQDIFQRALEAVEAGMLAIIRPLLDDAFRMDKAAQIMPLPDYLGLDNMSIAWVYAGTVVSSTDGNLSSALHNYTDRSNGEWNVAMRQFCSAVWGTSDWGKSREGHDWGHDKAQPGRRVSHPIMDVMLQTCDVMSDALRAWAAAAEDVRDDLRGLYYEAVIKALPHIDRSDGIGMKDLKSIGKGFLNIGKGFAQGFALEVDQEAMNAAVEAYNNRVRRQVVEINKLHDALDEAYLSAPTFDAESARAESFGARALTEFKGDPLYTVPGDDEANHKYPVDLANQEGMLGSHVVDKHVGKTDEQLEQRLRDQMTVSSTGSVGPKAASTFTDLAGAQRYTQATLDDPGNQVKITSWLAQNPGPRSRKELGIEVPDVVGRTWTRGDNAAHDTKKVLVILKPRPGGHPPYVVLTSMPSDRIPQ
ncbi:RNase A-like domain-containing protein [Streptomyces sp. NBC_01353]|uniref:RNase A-like domain-containing protein n=1 Tax=Streptomyces sp. NBC_01353 TaxID=2903835 RepID=UPI002E2FBDFF|nr:RNase A-like domain-containing protein [Streptomyces sp. NBC_01353]